jgi:hypothetical protein
MRWGLIAVGMLVDLMGVIWMLQGLNVLGGSPMTGDPFWVFAGGVLSAVGLGMIVYGMRPRSGAPPA